MEREAVWQVKIARHDDRFVGYPATSTVRQRDDTALARDGGEERAGGIDRQGSRCAETRGEDVDPKARGDGRERRLR